VDTGFGFVEQQIWDGESWISTGETHSIPAGPGAPSAPSFASTQAAQAQQEAFVREQDRLNREFRAEQERLGREASEEAARIAEEAAHKRNRLSTLTDLIQMFVGSQTQARDILANLQPDQFRFAAVAGGITPFGVTPQQGFQEQLQQFAGAPVPTADPNAPLPSIESAIEGLTGAQVPLPPTTFGMAKGGTVAPSAQPQSFLVGEKGPEVMTVTAQSVQVTPLVGGMQAGGTVGFPFEPIKFDVSTLTPALATSGIFGSLGLTDIPFRQPPGMTPAFPSTFQDARSRGGRGVGLTGETLIAGFPHLKTMGIQPRIVRDISTGAIYQITGNTRQRITNLEALQGLAPSDVTGALTAEIFQMAPNEGPSLSTLPQAPTTQPSPFTKFSTPIIEPTTGAVLPAPFMVAEQLNKLRLTNPSLFNLMLSAYTTAGVPAEAVMGSMQQALVFGQERGNIGLR
jgi:hypothetical protein